MTNEYQGEWFNATHAEGWGPITDELRYLGSGDQRSITITHKDGKRIGCTLMRYMTPALRCHDELVAAAELFSKAKEPGELEAALEATRQALHNAKKEERELEELTKRFGQ